MKIVLVTVGKAHDPAIKDAINDFTARIKHVFPIEWAYVPTDSREKESARIVKLFKPDDFVVLLDEKGKEWSSPELGDFLQTRMNEGTKRIVFVIGGAYGVDHSVLARAHRIWSLSKLIFPHQIVRLILAEQIYRGLSIIRGEKYHHA